MLSIGLCAAAFLCAYLAGKRSLVNGLIVVMAVGYFYGILRANLSETGSHFVFDAAVWDSTQPICSSLVAALTVDVNSYIPG